MKFIPFFLLFLCAHVGEAITNDILNIDTNGALSEIVAPLACLVYALLLLRKDRKAAAQKRERAQRQKETLQALEQQLQTRHYTDAEIEYLIYHADLSTGQKDILRRKHFNCSSKKES